MIDRWRPNARKHYVSGSGDTGEENEQTQVQEEGGQREDLEER